MTDKTKLQRFYSYAYTRPWAWVILRYLVVPVVAAVTIVREHVPEFIDEVRTEWAQVEAERADDLASAKEVDRAPDES